MTLRGPLKDPEAGPLEDKTSLPEPKPDLEAEETPLRRLFREDFRRLYTYTVGCATCDAYCSS